MKEQKILKNFIKYVSLNILGMIGLSFYILADTFFIANALGANGLTALNFSISVYCIIHGTGLMIGIGGGTRYAILKSQHEDKKANELFTQTVCLGVIAGFVFALIGLFFSTEIAQVLGADENTLNMTSTYLKIILCFSPCFILNNIMLAFVRNDSNPKLSMSAMIIGSISNIILDYIFIFPLNMGMFGASFATGLAPIISLIVLSAHFYTQKNQFSFVKCKMKLKKVKDILSLGLSAFVTEVSSGIVLIIFNLVILRLEGNLGVAAYGIVANLALVAVCVFTGIAQGIQPLVSKGYGTHNRLMLQQVLRYSIILSVGISIIIYVVTFMYSDVLIGAFNSEKNEHLVALATQGFHLYFIGFIFAGFNIIIAAFLSATERTKNAFMISIIRGCIAIIPFIFLLTLIWGMNGVWLSFVCAELVASIVGFMYIKKPVLNLKNKS